MLDLNFASPHDVPSGDGLQEIPGNLMDDSGTSNSSVLNADGSMNAGDEDSCSTKSPAPTFCFGILKEGFGDDNEEAEEGEDFAEEVNNSRSHHEVVTKQLFPLAAAGQQGYGNGFVPHLVGMAAHMPSSSSASKSSLEESFCQPAMAEPPKVTTQQQQQQQQVKKSRRGPRSRSSQYRGVTFYRRTGRWESHIWLVMEPTRSFPPSPLPPFFFFSSDQTFLFRAGIAESRCIWVRKPPPIHDYFCRWVHTRLLPRPPLFSISCNGNQ